MEQRGSWLYWRGGGGRIPTGGVELLLVLLVYGSRLRGLLGRGR